MSRKIILTFTLISLLLQLGLSQTNGDKVFDPTTLHVLKFSSEEEPDLYELLQEEAWSFFDRPYHLVKMEFDGEEMDSIGLRAKGFFSSIDEEQTPLKIDINEYVDGQTFDGLKKINLTNSFLDEYRQKDRLSYELFRRSGVASPRTSYTEVYVNEEFINIYLLVQQVDKTFISEHFSDEGSLLKIAEPIYGNEDFDNVIFVSSQERFTRVNLRNYFKFILINTIIDAQDNYPTNNFYCHYSEKEDLFQFIPWDYNLSMNLNWPSNNSIHPLNDSIAIWADPAIKNVYLELACELKSYLLDDSYIANLTQNNQATILSNSQGAVVADSQPLLDFLKGRQDWLINQLSIEDFNCDPFFYPLETGDLVINEFAATSDSIGGIQEPDSGTPDWIELFNNTDQDIILNHHYYLSDDVDFPKKWNFKSDVIIPAKGYQIVWADRDVDQQNVHSNFKIEKSQGDLLLVYEDMTIIDQVNYEEQELNMSFARVPNGTGDFTIQEYTFNASNDEISSTDPEEQIASIQVYPNPTRGKMHVITSDQIKSISIFSATGELIKTQKSKQKIIDLEQVPSGIYFIHIQTDQQHKVLRFMKV